MEKTKVVNVRLSEETIATVKEMAEEKKIPFSSLMREMIEFTILPSIIEKKVMNEYMTGAKALEPTTNEELLIYIGFLEKYMSFIEKAEKKGSVSLDEIKGMKTRTARFYKELKNVVKEVKEEMNKQIREGKVDIDKK